MSDLPRTIPDFIAENYATARVESGKSWEELASDFDANGYDDLALWSRSDHSADPVSVRSATEAAEARRDAVAKAEADRVAKYETTKDTTKTEKAVFAPVTTN